MTLLIILGAITLQAQPVRDTNNRLVDNSLSFLVVSEKIQTSGALEVCIADTTFNCIANVITGYVIRVYNSGGEVLWAGKTAGREEKLIFPKPMPTASWVVFSAFKPYVVNVMTGDRIYQNQPIETKYILSNE